MTARQYMMKRRVLILCLAVVAFMLCAACAMAETDPIVCDIELSPAKLAGPGTVNVTITISNSGDTDMKDPVVLYDPAAKIVSDFGTNGAALLKAGESKTWTGSYDVNQRTLDNGSVVYFVKYVLYKESGEAVDQSQPIRGKISQQTAEADIDVKRTISPTIAKEGQKIVVKYEIMNSGTIDLTDITIKENADIHKEKQTIPKLEPGKTALIEYPAVTMGKKDLTSGATITYKSANNKKAQTYTVEDTKITYGESALSAKLTASAKGVAVNEKVTLKLELKNGGSVDYSDLRVTDPVLGDVFTNQKLEAGKSVTLEKEITLTETANYQFTINAIDSTGTETVTATDAVTVAAVAPEDVLTLTLTATPDRTEVYEQPGLVRFAVDIVNNSRVDAKKVSISHGNTVLYTFETIPAGETRRLTRDTALSMAGKYRFTATAQDPLENTLTFQSNEVQIAFSVPTPAPATATPPPQPTPEPTFSPVTVPPIGHRSVGTVPKTIQAILLPILIIAGVLLITAGVLLILATKRRADQKKASEAAFDHLERAKRRDYVTPAEEEEEQKPDATMMDGKTGAAAGQEKSLLEEEDLDDFELPHMKYVRSAVSGEGAASGEDDYSTLGQGLYDEEMTSDLSAYVEPDGDSVLYEQPYDESGAYEEDGYTEGFENESANGRTDGAAGDEQGYENTGYVDGYGAVDENSGYADGYDDPEGTVGYEAGYDDAGYESGYDVTYDESYDDYGYEDDGIDGHAPDDREAGYEYGSETTDENAGFRRPKPPAGEEPPRAAGRRSRQTRSGDEDVSM